VTTAFFPAYRRASPWTFHRQSPGMVGWNPAMAGDFFICNHLSFYDNRRREFSLNTRPGFAMFRPTSRESV
jgi:hypothetical protein